jgi:hypothetical protein
MPPTSDSDCGGRVDGFVEDRHTGSEVFTGLRRPVIFAALCGFAGAFSEGCDLSRGQRCLGAQLDVSHCLHDTDNILASRQIRQPVL